MKERHGNVKKIFEPIKEGEPLPDIHFYLNYQCLKCGAKYGKRPEFCCYGYKMVQIKPEYQSLMPGKGYDNSGVISRATHENT